MASIFSKIIAGELPGHFVWQDEQVVAIMTIQPIKSGHVLVIPREEIDHWDDLPPELAAHCAYVSQVVAKAIKAEFPCKRVGVMLIGLEVPHTHIHLVPLDAMGDASFAKAKEVGQEALAEAAAKLRGRLREMGRTEADFEG